MNSLTVSTAITGLLNAAAAIRDNVGPFMRRVKHAPPIAETVVMEAASLQAVLPRLRKTIEVGQKGKGAQIEASLLGPLATTLTGYVKRVAELERLLESLPTRGDFGDLERNVWLRYQTQIKHVLEGIQPCKLALSVLLHILTMEPLRRGNDGLHKIQKSLNLVCERVLGGDPDLTARMASMDTDEQLINDLSMSEALQRLAPFDDQPAPLESDSTPLADGAVSVKSAKWSSAFRKRGNAVDSSRKKKNMDQRSTRQASEASIADAVPSIPVSKIAVYKLPIAPNELANGYHYSSAVSHQAERLSIVTESSEGSAESVFSRQQSPHRQDSAQYYKSKPVVKHIVSRPLNSDLPQDSAYKPRVLEARMTTRVINGYWRPEFTADIPSAVAICGCMLLTCDYHPIQIPRDGLPPESAAVLCDFFNREVATADLMSEPQSFDLTTILHTLQIGIERSRTPLVPTKTAFPLYQLIAASNSGPAKNTLGIDDIFALIKKIPQDTLVLLLFLLEVVRRLQRQGVVCEGRRPLLFLLAGLWPEAKTRISSAAETSAGDAVSQYLLEHYDFLAEQVPCTIQVINCKNRAGQRCNLLTWMVTSKDRPRFYVRMPASSGKH